MYVFRVSFGVSHDGAFVVPERLYMRSPGIQRPRRVLKLGVGCPCRPQSVSSVHRVLVSQ